MLVDLALYRNGRRTLLTVEAATPGEAIDKLMDHLAPDAHVSHAGTDEMVVHRAALQLDVDRTALAYHEAVQRKEEFEQGLIAEVMDEVSRADPPQEA